MSTTPSLLLFNFALQSENKTEALFIRISDDGQIHLTPNRYGGRFVIGVQVGQFDTSAMT